jgi:hypothetical protein
MIYTAPCIMFWMRAYPLRGRPVCSAQCPERMGPLGKPTALPSTSTLSRTSSRTPSVTLTLSEPQR